MHQTIVSHLERLRAQEPRTLSGTEKPHRALTLRQPVPLNLYRICGDDLQRLRVTPAINFLTLDSNRISGMSQLRALAVLSDLEILQIHDNPLTNNPNYRS
jgi:hypothetical protein